MEVAQYMRHLVAMSPDEHSGRRVCSIADRLRFDVSGQLQPVFQAKLIDISAYAQP
jgi:hypothetical protein